MEIKENMGNLDRVIRVIAAIFFVVAFFSGITSGALGILLLVVSVVFLGTAIFGLCPIYYLIGLSSKSNHSDTAR